MLKLGIDPEKLYRTTFISQYGLCCCNMVLVSFRLFCKNLGHLRKFFGQMAYRPPWQKISRTPMVWLVVKRTTTFNRQSLFFSTTEYHLRALFFPEATLLGVWSFNLNLLQAYRKVNIGGDWVSKSLVFLFISRFLFTVFYPGKNVDTPTSPLYADKKYTHQNKFKIILPCNNK